MPNWRDVRVRVLIHRGRDRREHVEGRDLWEIVGVVLVPFLWWSIVRLDDERRTSIIPVPAWALED